LPAPEKARFGVLFQLRRLALAKLPVSSWGEFNFADASNHPAAK